MKRIRKLIKILCNELSFGLFLICTVISIIAHITATEKIYGIIATVLCFTCFGIIIIAACIILPNENEDTQDTDKVKTEEEKMIDIIEEIAKLKKLKEENLNEIWEVSEKIEYWENKANSSKKGLEYNKKELENCIMKDAVKYKDDIDYHKRMIIKYSEGLKEANFKLREYKSMSEKDKLEHYNTYSNKDKNYQNKITELKAALKELEERNDYV